MLEEDQKFYATFPEAWRAAIEQEWRYKQAPPDQYFEGPGFQCCAAPVAYTTASNYNHYSFDAHAMAWAADTNCYTPAFYAKAQYMNDGYGCSLSMEGPRSGVLPLNSMYHGWTEHQRDWEVDHLVRHYTVRVCYFSFGVSNLHRGCPD